MSFNEVIMGIQEQRQSEREQRKTAITNTAVKVFLRKGLPIPRL